MAEVNGTILAVDDSPETLEVMQRILQGAGYRVFTAPAVPPAVTFLKQNPVELVITDLKMPGASGQDLVRHLQENHPQCGIMMITGYPSIAGAVAAVKHGAEEYLPKPFTDRELLEAVGRTMERVRQRRQAQQPAASPAVADGLVGGSAAIRRIRATVAKVSATPATVLITGESGTGKELIARAIHYRSDRAAAPFVAVNCSAIPEALLESELFGHRRGAFTGAIADRNGFFQIADGGTLFLDEVGDTSLAMQAKLMRVLQDREVWMVGDERPRTVDVRIIAATNRQLPALIRQERFREDLYYRLAVVTVAVPPLRERGDDIPLLARSFLDRFIRSTGRRAPLSFTPAALDALRGYAWPGNVRELENLVQRLAIMHEGERIEPSDLPPGMRFAVRVEPDWHRSLAEVEQEHLRRVLAGTGNNLTRAAAVLGIDRKTLRLKLKRE